MMHFQNMVKNHNMFFASSESLNKWSPSIRSNTERTSHLEFPNTENVSLTKG